MTSSSSFLLLLLSSTPPSSLHPLLQLHCPSLPVSPSSPPLSLGLPHPLGLPPCLRRRWGGPRGQCGRDHLLLQPCESVLQLSLACLVLRQQLSVAGLQRVQVQGHAVHLVLHLFGVRALGCHLPANQKPARHLRYHTHKLFSHILLYLRTSIVCINISIKGILQTLLV